MASFKSLGALASHLTQASALSLIPSLSAALEKVGQAVEDEVKKEIGTYQSAIGPYPATAPLSPVTLERKSKEGQGKGGNPDTPLYATGDFEGDIGHKVDQGSLSVVIGTNTKYIEYTELGTSKMPPRPIFGPSALRVLPKMKPLIAGYAMAGITGFGLAAFASGTVHTSMSE